MLTEQFVASIAAPTKPNAGVTKDAGIFFHQYQPPAGQGHVYKKSATAPNGLAVSKSHIFAAQAEKAVVHVYSREKKNQEAIVPFPERIHSITLASKDAILLLGTESGRVLAWEICSGRLVSTSTSHLQPVTSLAVDPTSNFFLSGSTDSMVHVWNLPAILSFSPDTSRSPVHTLSNHRGPLSGLVCGHSSTTANIAVSVSQDKSAIVWDYHTGRALRTYLLPDTPVAVTLDPADRAFYVAYEDGSFQTISFYDDFQQSTPADTIRDPSLSHRPIQPSPKTRFNAESQKLGGALSISLSWDGTTLISGHVSGKIAVWDIAKGNYISTLTPLPGPVTNLQLLEPTGFPTALEAKNKLHTVVKPRKDLGTISGSGIVPPNYSLSMQFTGGLDLPSISATERRTDGMSGFNEALTHSSFPLSMLEESLCELETWNAQLNSSIAPAAEFLPVTGTEEDATGLINNTGLAPDTTKDTEIAELKKQLASLQRIQKVTFTQLSELREEKQYFLAKERERAVQEQGQTKHKPGLANGSADADGDVDMSEGSASESAASESNDDDESDEDEEEDKGAESE